MTDTEKLLAQALQIVAAHQRIDELAARMQHFEDELQHVMGVRELRARSKRELARAFQGKPHA